MATGVAPAVVLYVRPDHSSHGKIRAEKGPCAAEGGPDAPRATRRAAHFHWKPMKMKKATTSARNALSETVKTPKVGWAPHSPNSFAICSRVTRTWDADS